MSWVTNKQLIRANTSMKVGQVILMSHLTMLSKAKKSLIQISGMAYNSVDIRKYNSTHICKYLSNGCLGQDKTKTVAVTAK